MNKKLIHLLIRLKHEVFGEIQDLGALARAEKLMKEIMEEVAK